MPNKALLSQWQTLMKTFGFKAHLPVFNALFQAYTKTQRHYHNVQHLIMCFQCLKHIPAPEYHKTENTIGLNHQQMTTTPKTALEIQAEVELALWFHDAIYHTQPSPPASVNNEQASAQWAYQFILEAGGHEKLADRIQHMILATQHESSTSMSHGFSSVPYYTGWLLDIDLAILGSDSRAYDKFEMQIRQEYSWVAWPVFRQARLSILEGFLNRHRIYHTQYFQNRLESTARHNLQRRITELHVV